MEACQPGSNWIIQQPKTQRVLDPENQTLKIPYTTTIDKDDFKFVPVKYYFSETFD